MLLIAEWQDASAGLILKFLQVPLDRSSTIWHVCLVPNLVPPANLLRAHFVTLSRLPMKMLNNIGPRFNSCGTYYQLLTRCQVTDVALARYVRYTLPRASADSVEGKPLFYTVGARNFG